MAAFGFDSPSQFVPGTPCFYNPCYDSPAARVPEVQIHRRTSVDASPFPTPQPRGGEQDVPRTPSTAALTPRLPRRAMNGTVLFTPNRNSCSPQVVPCTPLALKGKLPSPPATPTASYQSACGRSRRAQEQQHRLTPQSALPRHKQSVKPLTLFTGEEIFER